MASLLVVHTTYSCVVARIYALHKLGYQFACVSNRALPMCLSLPYGTKTVSTGRSTLFPGAPAANG